MMYCMYMVLNFTVPFDLQKDRIFIGVLLVARIDGNIYNNLLASRGDKWKKRRQILTPAFSANKMRMVSLCVNVIYVIIRKLKLVHVCDISGLHSMI